MSGVIVFDVNETLLDLSVLDKHFRRAFGDQGVRQSWFAQMLQVAMTLTIIGKYEDFSQAAKAALKMTAEQKGVRVSGHDQKTILSAIKSLPPHPDVRPALEQLRQRGLRLATLTNSATPVALEQLTSAGLIGFFEKTLSVDAVQRYKPAPEAYQYAARELEVSTADILMVAAHSWDCEGAKVAGCRTVFVQRPGKAMNPLAPKPDFTVKDLAALVRKMK